MHLEILQTLLLIYLFLLGFHYEIYKNENMAAPIILFLFLRQNNDYNYHIHTP